MKTVSILPVFVAVSGLMWGVTADSAQISAIPSTDILSVSETAQIDIYMELDPTEAASVFEGVFDLEGYATSVALALTSGGASWPNAFGNIIGDQLRLSLTSNNDGTAMRLVASLNVTALAPGFFVLSYNDATFASFDIDIAPFTQDLPLNNYDGQVLASIRVIPLPAAAWLLISALALVLGSSKAGGWVRSSNPMSVSEVV